MYSKIVLISKNPDMHQADPQINIRAGKSGVSFMPIEKITSDKIYSIIFIIIRLVLLI
jgi:hypothetical protein